MERSMKNEQIEQVPVELIDFAPQVRENPEDEAIEFVAESLKENGQLHPVRLLPVGARYQVVTGARRLLAARRRGWQSIAAIIERADLSEADILMRRLTENGARKALRPIELALGLKRLIDLTGLPAGEAARRIGASGPTASKLLSLLSLSEDVQNKVQAGQIPESTAYVIASQVPDRSKQVELAAEVAERGLTRDEVMAAVRETRATTNSKSSASRGIAKLEGGRSVSVRGDGLTLELFVACLEKVLASARKARRQGVELASFLKAFNAEARSI
jgi:ParB family transcriptional regulator, chromosome partitioning protein